MNDDIEKIADRLTPNMVRSLTWWCHDGSVSSEVDDSTRKGLVRRGLGTWASAQFVELTDLGRQVREVLLERQRVAKEAELQMLAERAAAERKIRDEGYEAGAMQARLAYLTQLNQAVYGCTSWPDRPLDSVWEHLLELVRKHFQPEEAA